MTRGRRVDALDARNRTIVEDWVSGKYTRVEISRRHNVSACRVTQIVREYGMPAGIQGKSIKLKERVPEHVIVNTSDAQHRREMELGSRNLLVALVSALERKEATRA